MKKKRNLPTLLTSMEQFQEMRIGFMGNRFLSFVGTFQFLTQFSNPTPCPSWEGLGWVIKKMLGREVGT